MPYADIAKVRRLLNPLSGQGTLGGGVIVGADGSCSLAMGSQSVNEAGTFIDGMLSKRYAVPFGSPAPGEIRWVANRLAAAYIIMAVKQGIADSASNFRFDKQQQYHQQAMTKLQALADGVDHIVGQNMDDSIPSAEHSTDDAFSFTTPGSANLRPASGL